LSFAATLVTPDSNCATRPQPAGVKRSAGSRHRFESAMDSYSIRFASGRISPNLDQQVGDCWLDTTGELRRARAQAAIRPEMRCPCHGASGRGGTDDLPLLGKRSIQLHPDFQANAAVPIDGDVAPARACCARTAFQTSPQHCGTTRESSDALAWRRITARGTLSSWSN